jgi:predicted transporter
MGGGYSPVKVDRVSRADSDDQPGDQLPQPVLVTAGLIALQGAGLVALALFLVVEVLVATSDSLTSALAITAFVLVGAAGLLLVARGVYTGQSWSRAPAIVAQLCVLPVSLPLVRGERWYVGVPLTVWAVAVIALVLSPVVTRHTAR